MEAEQKLTKSETLSAIGKILVKVIRLSPQFLVIAAVEEIISRSVPFINAWLLARLINILPHVVHSSGAQSQAVRFIIYLAIATMAPNILASLTGAYKARQQVELNLKIERSLQESFTGLPYALYEDKTIIDAFDRAGRFSRGITSFVMNRLVYIFGSFTTVAIATVAFWHFSPQLAIVIFVLSLPSVWLELRLQRMRESLWRDNTQNYLKATAHGTLLDPRIIKESRLLGLVGFALDKSQHYKRKADLADLRAEQRTEKYRFLTALLNAAIEVLVLIRAVQRIAAGSLPFGQFVFVQQVASQYLGSLSSLGGHVQDLDELLFGINEYVFITEYPREAVGEPIRDAKSDIKLQGVSFRYPGSKLWALRDIDMVIPYGETIAIVGENGAGKSTLIKLLMKLYEPAEGRISIADQDLRAIDSTTWHRNIGVLFQDFQIFYDFTIRDNVWFGDIDQPHDASAITKMLRSADADKFSDELPYKDNTYLGKYMDETNGTDLSGGQAQRLAIARTLFRDANTLILDEPTSAIDAKAEYKIFKEIDKARSGRTTILISHRFSTVRKASYVYVLEKGRLKEQGTHNQLMTQRGLYYEMFTKQAEGYR